MSCAVRAFSTGVVRPKRGERGVRRYLPGGWSDSTKPVLVFAIRHPDGLCLFDAGQTPAAAAPGYFPWWHPFFRLARFELGPGDGARIQLERLGLGPRVRWLVLSHLHTDHAGGLSELDAEEVIVSRTEWDRATGLPGRFRGYLPSRWPPGEPPRLVDFATDPLGPFAGSVRLAETPGCRLLLVPLPGHTPGHLGLLVEAGRRFLLAGDAAETAAGLEEAAPAVARFCRERDIQVLTSHDPGVPALLAAA